MYLQVSSRFNLSASEDNILLRGMGGVSLEGKSVNVAAVSGVMLQSQRVSSSPLHIHSYSYIILPLLVHNYQ